MQITASINGGAKQSATLDHIGEVDGWQRHQAYLDGVLWCADVKGSFLRVTADNGVNAPETRPIVFDACVDCNKFAQTVEQPVMARTTFCFGDVPPETGKPFCEISPPREATWTDADLQKITQENPYGIQKAFTDTGARPELSVHHPNWVLNRAMRRAYADADGIYATSNREPVAPYAPILQDGYTTGLNSFSHVAWKAYPKIGRKPQLPHLYANSDYAADVDGDPYYRDSVIFTGNYAAMYNGGAWPGCASELRGIGRGLRAMVAATRLDGSEYRKAKIRAAIADMDVRHPFDFPFTQKTDKTKGKYVTWWEMVYVAYAIDFAIRSKIIEKSACLDVILAFQSEMTPATVGCHMPYWLLYRDQSAEPKLANLVATNEQDREAELYVMQDIMRRYGFKTHRPQSELMQPDPGAADSSKYPIRNNAAFFIGGPAEAAAWNFGGTRYESLSALRSGVIARCADAMDGYDGSANLSLNYTVERV